MTTPTAIHSPLKLHEALAFGELYPGVMFEVCTHPTEKGWQWWKYKEDVAAIQPLVVNNTTNPGIEIMYWYRISRQRIHQSLALSPMVFLGSYHDKIGGRNIIYIKALHPEHGYVIACRDCEFQHNLIMIYS